VHRETDGNRFFVSEVLNQAHATAKARGYASIERQAAEALDGLDHR